MKINCYICNANVNNDIPFRRATVIGSNILSGIFYALIQSYAAAVFYNFALRRKSCLRLATEYGSRLFYSACNAKCKQEWKN